MTCAPQWSGGEATGPPPTSAVSIWRRMPGCRRACDVPALDDVLAAVAAAMHESGARWYLFGAQAATLWGRPRLTADVDITAEIRFEDLDKFLEAMKRQGFTLRFDDRDFVNRTRVYPFLHDRTGLPLDVVLAGPGLEEDSRSRDQRSGRRHDRAGHQSRGSHRDEGAGGAIEGHRRYSWSTAPAGRFSRPRPHSRDAASSRRGSRSE